MLSAARAQVAAHFSPAEIAKMTFNMAGSPTFGLYSTTSHANEISAGSALVKPSDFDLPILKAFKPAAFIATPALKVSRGIRLPALEYANNLLESQRRAQLFLSMAAIGWRNQFFRASLKTARYSVDLVIRRCWSARRAQIWLLMILFF